MNIVAIIVNLVPSGPPQSFVVSPSTSRSLTLQWDPPLPLEVNGIITDYTITIFSNSHNFSLQVGSNATNYNLASLRPYTRYTCNIAAHTMVGRGPFSIHVSVTTPEEAPEAPPVSVMHSNVMSDSVALAWSAPQVDLQNGIIRHYRIEAYENTTGRMYTYQTPSNQLTFVITNLHPYYIYTVRIQAVTVGPGPLSLLLTILTAENGECVKYTRKYYYFKIFFFLIVPSAAPQNPTGLAINSTHLSIVWSPPPAEHINGIIDQYVIEVREVVTNNTWVFYSIITEVSVGPLHPFYEYMCRVSASTIGQGPYTTSFSVISGEAGK